MAQQCDAGGAQFLRPAQRLRLACSGTSFHAVDADGGRASSLTIVSFAAPGVPVPFVAGVVDCGGTSVRANVINTDPDPTQVRTGMPVQLATFVVGTDSEGVEAVGFGFEPVEATS
ncbi:MAG: OB-fold domain-containing protein [Acidimicrobiales bacterium]